ncbi:XRE family transcriptional regulator [Saccharibacillus sp. CPCC 101409]|uniref:helix-turn-helix domain-containing protein n=1 Tax=Saccharibacillus sp. CPCC 101409 TaxID=3058041 RepID=UPI002672A4B2|nr:XRE family transcriptional regulator [Saccharibacillus sp. CPCC 101409]MDO3408950.1 XRE family transcriptional regulator [Saccharibacillus sp. CPCC 101409]
MLGNRLREARKSKNLTLAELAGQIGVTTGYLSNLEKNRQEPSLAVLRSLSGQLDIPAPVLFMDEQDEEAIVLRKGERSPIRFADLPVACDLLTPMNWRSSWSPEIEVLRLALAPGERLKADDLSTDTDECVYVTEGRVEYRYGNEAVSIESGGSLYVPRRTGYVLINTGEREAVLLWAVRSVRPAQRSERT